PARRLVPHGRPRDPTRRHRSECRRSLARPSRPPLLPRRLGHARVPGRRRPRDRDRTGPRPAEQRGFQQHAGPRLAAHPHVHPRFDLASRCGRPPRRDCAPHPARGLPRPPEPRDRHAHDPQFHARGPAPRLRQDRADEGPLRLLGPLQARLPKFPVPPRTRLWSAARVARGLYRVLRANPLTFVGFLMVAFIAILALLIVALPFVTGLFGPAVSILPHDPNELLPCAIPTECATPPSAQYWFGTDNVGRDMFSRVLAALPLDLAIGFGVAGFALLVGTGLGLVAGFWDTPGTLGGALSIAIMRITDMFLAFPSLVLALAIAASLGRGTGPALIAIMITWWPFYVRLVRGEVLAVKHLPYVAAARAAGVSGIQILFRHVFRNILEPLVVYYTMDVDTVIVTFSTISFIGIG